MIFLYALASLAALFFMIFLGIRYLGDERDMEGY